MPDVKTCPVCGKTYASAGALWYHKKKKHDGGRDRGGTRDSVSAGSVPRTRDEGPATSAAQPSAGFEPFYPSMDAWRRTREEKAESKAEPKAVGPSLQPVTLDLSSFWMAAGAFIDDHMPKDSRIRVDMNDKKTESLNKGLEQMGLVTLPAPTVLIPNWAPLLIAVATIFGIPIAIMVKELIGKVKDDLKERREKKKEVPPPVVIQAEGATAAVPVVPSNPGPQPYHEPGTD